MNNLDIRLIVADNGLHYKDIAKTMGISSIWLCKMMRKPLSPRNKSRVLDAIETLKGADPRDE